MLDWNQENQSGSKFRLGLIIPISNGRYTGCEFATVYIEKMEMLVGLDPNDPIEVNMNQNFEGETNSDHRS